MQAKLTSTTQMLLVRLLAIYLINRRTVTDWTSNSQRNSTVRIKMNSCVSLKSCLWRMVTLSWRLKSNDSNKKLWNSQNLMLSSHNWSERWDRRHRKRQRKTWRISVFKNCYISESFWLNKLKITLVWGHFLVLSGCKTDLDCAISPLLLLGWSCTYLPG
jgi:hypothetical protein